MNPPFSATAGRVKGKRDTKVGGQHVEQALARLRPGGRLVALVGEGMAADRPAFRDWWSAIRKKYNVRANIGISGEAYRKFGTTFDNQILVIDKTGPTKDPGAIITGKVDQVEDLIGLLEVIRNDRTHPGQQFPAESGGQALAGPGSLPGYVVSPATGTAGTFEKRLLTHTAMEGNEGAMEFAIEKLQREKPEDAMEMLVSPDDPDEVRLTPEDLDGASLEDGALLVAELIHQLLIEERD